MKTRPDPSSKPYYRCLSCMRFGISCSGHSTRDMGLQSWCEYMRDIKEVKHLTNAYIANAADVSIKTIERIMAISIDQDIRRETARRIEVAIIGTANQYPCYLAFEESSPDDAQKLGEALRELERALHDKEDYRAVIDNIHASYNAELQTIRDEAQKKINHLLVQVDRLRIAVDAWRLENDRKAKVIDKFIDK